MSGQKHTLRVQAKRQISAARALLATIRTLALRSADAALDRDSVAQQILRLEAETEGLARIVYAGTTPANPQA
ncbi:hypothetical protein [Bordetella bronchiseptica]|uniref:hypothetical protein n=1 Tax=Bordetella bronchiseptica TaxID=518 RepID=UPI00052842CD|nr:hypothetical protein [Bordetella bronchiseptica]